ncbi:MAG: hypothetical protein GTO53_13165 [Planctomycetales bacterium]|nr:hypothetical protein [Planctomycetales bacterium]NIM10046.1 hypothetical protein [Planctomycetales bacterium]NIN09487.1 hypothetical protein [Planctomycetales bacterium]NIN77150.1 hypothetical protein [Planctomycetales bacterium]NIO34334.1 hypothetical protein [Planctomycetales bacterium]
MNYLAHARQHLDDPYFVAGTALPDWLNVVARKVRVRRRHAAPFEADSQAPLAAIARGVLQHHHDDAWFHRTPAFAQLSLEMTVRVREALPGDEGMRVFFLGHILVELLLDAELAGQDPQLLPRYYQALARVDPGEVAGAVRRMSGWGAEPLAELIPRFIAERFLWDYADDDKLLWRLNQVMQRVRLSPLPHRLTEIFPAARLAVSRQTTQLLTPDPPNVPA